MRRAAGTLAVAAAALLVAASSGIVLPAPSRALLPLAVAAPELSAWLLALAVLLAIASRAVRDTPARRATLLLSVCAGALALRPLAETPRAGREIADGLQSAFGADYLARVDPQVRARLRPERISVRELFGGIRAGPRRRTTDVTYASPGGVPLTLRIYEPSNGGGPVVVQFYGPSDLTRGYREPPSPDPIGVRATLEALLGGSPETVPARYREASPVAYASAGQPPTMQITGGRDHVVLPRFADALHGQLRAAGNVSILIELTWAEHAFDAVPFGPGAQLTRWAVERFLAATTGRTAATARAPECAASTVPARVECRP